MTKAVAVVRHLSTHYDTKALHFVLWEADMWEAFSEWTPGFRRYGVYPFILYLDVGQSKALLI